MALHSKSVNNILCYIAIAGSCSDASMDSAESSNDSTVDT